MKKYNRSLPYTISTVYVVIVKIWTVIIKTYFPNNEILKNIGTANGIFKKAASDFDYSVDYLIVIVYVMLLIVLYKYEKLIQKKYVKNAIYISTIFLTFLTIATAIVFQEYRGWDLSLYCVTEISKDIYNPEINIYDFKYQKIRPGLSPLVWLYYNKICNFNILGFSYFNHYFWFQMLFGIVLVLKFFKFSIIEALCLATGLNLSLLHMIRTGNYGYIFAIVMAICLRNLVKEKNINLNIFLLSVISFLKIQYAIIIALYLFIKKTNFRTLLSYSFKFFGIYVVFYGLQVLLFKNAIFDYFSVLVNGYSTTDYIASNYITWELALEAGITNPVTSQFISRFFGFEMNVSRLILIIIVLFGLYFVKNKNTIFLLISSLFERNKSYDSNYLLLSVEENNITEFIFAFCFIPNLLFLFGSMFSIGLLSELLYVPGLFYVVLLSVKKRLI